MTHNDWWRGGVIYQVYPRSFFDSNGDGIGDLLGVLEKIDYIASLNVDAIWLSPFFTSPMKDFGYDVSDYRGVDPLFGTLADFSQLVQAAHARGIRMLIDQVLNHSSDQHEWFKESRSSRDNPKADWYVWADAKPDGSPPSNWQSVFGGPAWTWDARRGQYYLHNFLSSQPQLNGHNPAVQDALLGVARFWLDRGVDGFRIDALNFSMHDPQLRDNPPAPASDRPRTRPFDFQRHVHNMSHPDIPRFIERIREVADGYDAIFTVAEVGGPEAEGEMKSFTAGGNRLNSAYGFNFLYAERLTPGLVCAALAQWPADEGVGWPSWAFENHDAPRAISRWSSEEDRERFARLKMLLLATLRGSIILYQGEELGLPQVDVPFHRLQDPEAIANWPRTLSRDGARTPMPWQAGAPQLGFSEVEPWLPVGESHAPLAVDLQHSSADSLLRFTSEALKLRNAHPSLRGGSMNVVRADDQVLVFERAADSEQLRCTFNLSGSPAAFTSGGRELFRAGDLDGGDLGPYSAVIEEIA